MKRLFYVIGIILFLSSCVYAAGEPKLAGNRIPILYSDTQTGLTYDTRTYQCNADFGTYVVSAGTFVGAFVGSTTISGTHIIADQLTVNGNAYIENLQDSWVRNYESDTMLGNLDLTGRLAIGPYNQPILENDGGNLRVSVPAGKIEINSDLQILPTYILEVDTIVEGSATEGVRIEDVLHKDGDCTASYFYGNGKALTNLTITIPDSYVRNYESDTIDGDFYGDTAYFSAHYGDGAGLENLGEATAVSPGFEGKVGITAGITAGQMVYMDGATGQRPLIYLCDNTYADSHGYAGMAIEDGALNANIVVRTNGLVTKLNTSAFSDGDTLWLAEDGGLTNYRPDTGVVEFIGYVSYSHGINGRIVLASHPEPYLSTIGTNNIDAKLGDNIGKSHFEVEDYYDSTVAWINSIGSANFSGSVAAASFHGAGYALTDIRQDSVILYSSGFDSYTQKTFASADSWTFSSQTYRIEQVFYTSSSGTFAGIPRLTFETPIDICDYQNLWHILCINEDIGTGVLKIECTVRP